MRTATARLTKLSMISAGALIMIGILAEVLVKLSGHAGGVTMIPAADSSVAARVTGSIAPTITVHSAAQTYHYSLVLAAVLLAGAAFVIARRPKAAAAKA